MSATGNLSRCCRTSESAKYSDRLSFWKHLHIIEAEKDGCRADHAMTIAQLMQEGRVQQAAL
ncbi:hypothetical protein PsYK624_120040 [Phanerochaete sordida]|uniref:Uncharacterized protein n=1 Tax=Phanerochaete sordida TaxID=48140 RepID=A0A9P3LIM0_9APHY|nr:hypothetical protein PsYK624_120040 [Phanerochaete sordida]